MPKKERNENEPKPKPPKPKLFYPNPGDVGDLGRWSPAIDECFAVEYAHTHGAEERRQARARVGDVRLHAERQDVGSDAWKQMLDLVEEAADDGRPVFWPGKDLAPEVLAQIIELPPTISKLTEVTHLRLYGSYLVRFPPEIGEMRSLVELDAYRSYRLHWFPFEITRCPALRDSRISTRALYGNMMIRGAFPNLDDEDAKSWSTGSCSVCGTPLGERIALLGWISLWVGTDVLPLLVRACSEGCLERVPVPPNGYVSRPHRGGTSLVQPMTYFEFHGKMRERSPS